MSTTREEEALLEGIRREWKKEEPPVKVKPKKMFKKVEKPSTKKGTPLSKVFNVKIRDGLPDPQITVFKKEDWEDGHMFNHIPEVDANYQFQVKTLIEVMIGLELGDNIWISGPTGSGKTTLVEQICAKVNRRRKSL